MSNQNPNLRTEATPDIPKDIRVLCTHLFDPTPHKPGHRCASPALRGESFCYYHHPTRRPLRETRSAWRIARRNFSVPIPTDREQLLDILTVVLQAIADNRVKLPHARRILYSLQQVGVDLEKVESVRCPHRKLESAHPSQQEIRSSTGENMIIINDEYVTLNTPTGPMRTHIVRPAAPGRYPGVIFYSEIFQITAPVRRTAAMLAGHGYIVAMPEIYHESEPAGTILPYDQTGSDRGNFLKTDKPIADYDADARAVLDHLASRPDCTGKLGAMGICIGGHLAFRAAMNPDVQVTACFYATDIHNHALGKGMQDNSLERAADIKGELLMIWGRQDPHTPTEGRMTVLTRLNDLGTRFAWHEVNAAHAFMRDEGLRYDPELAYRLYGEVFDLFHRKLGEGDVVTQTSASTETRH